MHLFMMLQRVDGINDYLEGAPMTYCLGEFQATTMLCQYIYPTSVGF